MIGEGNLIEEQALIINGSIESTGNICKICCLDTETRFACIQILTLLSDLFYSYPENITPDTEIEPKTMTIGMNNVFEVGCGILFELPDHSNLLDVIQHPL